MLTVVMLNPEFYADTECRGCLSMMIQPSLTLQAPNGVSYKTFYVRNLQMLVISYMFVSGKSFQPSLMFVGKARSLL
jgi:hypothetical protein